MVFRDLQEIAMFLTETYGTSQTGFTESKLKVWFLLLQDLDGAETKKVVTTLCSTEVFCPNPAKIRQEMGDVNTLSSQKAFEIAFSYATKFGFYRSVEAMEDMEVNYPLVHKAVRNMGGFSVIIQNEHGLRSRFVNSYELVKDKQIAFIDNKKSTMEIEIESSALTQEEKIVNLQKYKQLLKNAL